MTAGIRLAMSVALAFATTTAALAQTAPSPSGRIISLMVPYPAGGLSDAIARNLAPAMGKAFGQTVIVENLGGASGGVAAQKLLTIPADGRMIFQGSPNELILSPLVNPDVKIKPEQFRLVTQITKNPLILLARYDLPANSIDELVELGKKAGDKGLTYGSVGIGSMYHIVTEDMAKQVGIKVTHVPYKGGAPLLQDIGGNLIDFTILPYGTSYKGLADQKRLKMLGWVSKTRSAFLPDLPAFGESKALPNFDHSIWAGMFVRADTPDDVVGRINAVMAAVMKDSDVRKAVENTGSIVVDATSTDVAAKFYSAETAKLHAMTKGMDLKPQ